MRGSMIKVGEVFKGKYYGFTTYKEGNKLNYKYDEEPQYFNYKQTTVAGSSVFTASKGYETKMTTYNNILNTYDQKFRIQTSDTHINFQVRGKIEIVMDGLPKQFVITKLTSLAGGVYAYNSTRNGELNTKKLPLLIELD